MHVTVSPSDPLPIYRQIMRQVTDAIAGGQLAPGDRLLSHRELSERVAVAPLTVKKAYDELEAEGYIVSERGRGTFVAARPPRRSRAASAGMVAEAARHFLATAYLAGLDYPAVLEALESAHSDLTDTPPATPRRKGSA